MRFALRSVVRPIRLLSLACVVTLAAGMLQAQPARPNPVAAKQAQNSSALLKKQATDLTTKYAQATGETKTAVDALATALNAASAAQAKAAGAYEAGVVSDVAAAAAEVAKNSAAVSHARDLLTVLESQATFASEAQVATWRKATTDPSMPQLEALLAARKTAAAAFGKVAAALTANAPFDVVETARDEAFVASKEVLLANRAWMASCDIARRIATAAKTNNEGLVTKVDELKKTDTELLALMKQQIELDLKFRKLERQRALGVAAANELAKAKKK